MLLLFILDHKAFHCHFHHRENVKSHNASTFLGSIAHVSYTLLLYCVSLFTSHDMPNRNTVSLSSLLFNVRTNAFELDLLAKVNANIVSLLPPSIV
jgi:hypothetical protein